jgi:nucleotide-binding universal stress UspA family protein
MLPIRKILYPTDFSDSARPAFELACALARDYGAALVLAHVAPPTRSFAPDGIAIPFLVEESDELRVRSVHLHPVGPGAEVEYHVREGDAGEQIL